MRPQIVQDDLDAVVEVLRRGEVGPGCGVERFEAALARALGAPLALAVSSPGAAFRITFQVLGVGPGRRVWMPTNAPLAAATAVQACGGEVEFLDVERASGNLDVRGLEDRLGAGPVPQVLVAGHCAGLPCDLEWLLALARRHDFALVEDATEALGARLRVAGRWWRVGEHPGVEASVFSFDAGALVTTARGGAVSTHDAARGARLARLRGAGVVREGEGPGSPTLELGCDCPLSDLQAALGASQLARLTELVSARREIAQRYLGELPGFGLPPVPAGREHAWQRFTIQCAASERDPLQAFLSERRIPAGPCAAPLSLEPWFQARTRATPCPNGEARARAVLELPIHPALSHAEQGRVLAALTDWMRMRRAA